MAIISIPTSIGGINIPGNVFAGPLGSLYKKNGLDYVRYPRDLESSTRSHVVLFTIKDRKGITVEEVKKAGGNVVSAAKGAYEKGVTETTKDIVNRASSVTVEGTIESANQIRKNILNYSEGNIYQALWYINFIKC